MFVGYFVHIHTIDKVKCRVFILTQLNINQRQRLWALMDTHTRQPLLYPLIYLIDHLALRSSATQSASLQALKFFYEFWHQKHGVTFCFSFYSSNHNPLIAIDCHWWTYSLFSLSGKYAFICTSVNHKVYYADHASTLYKYQACTFGYSFYQIFD